MIIICSISILNFILNCSRSAIDASIIALA